MNVYDFDKTIYDGDSTAHFIFYTFKNRPLTLITIPRILICSILYVLHIMPKLTYKQQLYRMFLYVGRMDELVESFIESHKKNIKQWYYDQQKEDDLIISASPEFIIVPFSKAIGIQHAMASRVNDQNGQYDGINCHGEEKVRRFYEAYPNGVIEEFYSDSRSDTPLAKIAKKAFLVKGNQRKPW